MEKPKILYLSVKKKWFDVMVTGEKKQEFRKPSDWLKARLYENTNSCLIPKYTPVAYDLVSITNGYGNSQPNFIAEFKGISKSKEEFSKQYSNGAKVLVVPEDIVIELGNIIEINNYDQLQ